MARSFVLVTGSRALDGAARFLTVPVVLHHFGRLDFGLVALAFSFQAFLTIADFGLSINAIRQFGGLLQKQAFGDLTALAHASSFYYMLVGLFNLAVMLGLGWFGGTWFELGPQHQEQFFWMMLALGVSSALSWSFAVHRQILQAASLAGWDEAINLVATVLTLLAVWATLHWNLAPAAYFALVLLPPLAPTVLRIRKVKATVPGFQIGFTRNWMLFKPLVGTSVLMFALMLSELLANNYRPIILAQQAGLESVTEFRIIQQISGFALLLLSGLMTVIYPTIARLDAAGEHDRIRAAIAQGSRLLLWAHLGILIALAFLSEAMLRLYVGPNYAHLAGPLALWLVTLVAYHNAIMTSVIMARSRLGAITTSALLNVVLSLALTYCFAPRYGVTAAVCSYSVYLGLQLAVMYLVSAPSAGAGPGLSLAGHVFTRPVLVAVFSAATAVYLAHLAQAAMWTSAFVFVIIFAGCALTVGGAARDWALLKRAHAA